MAAAHVFGAADANAVYRLAAQGTRLGRQTRHALEVVEQALRRYGFDKTSLSFNGGKDCTVLLHIFAAAVSRLPAPTANGHAANGDAPTPPPRRLLKSLYVRSPSPFPQVEEFIEASAHRYGLDLVRISANMRDALARYRDAAPGVDAVIIGTRRSDPHCAELGAFQETDPGWTPFMRVHPILDWSYADVWAFLRDTEAFPPEGVPYCSLYDYGYTSLGSTHDTFPNPQLRALSEPSTWRPAWQLEDESAERAGRERRKPDEPAGPVPR